MPGSLPWRCTLPVVFSVDTQLQTVVPQLHNILPLQTTTIGGRESSALVSDVMPPGAEKEAATAEALVDSN